MKTQREFRIHCATGRHDSIPTGSEIKNWTSYFRVHQYKMQIKQELNERDLETLF